MCRFIDTMTGTGFYGRDTDNEVRIQNAYPSIITSEVAKQLNAVQRLYSSDHGRKTQTGVVTVLKGIAGSKF